MASKSGTIPAAVSSSHYTLIHSSINKVDLQQKVRSAIVLQRWRYEIPTSAIVRILLTPILLTLVLRTSALHTSNTLLLSNHCLSSFSTLAPGPVNPQLDPVSLPRCPSGSIRQCLLRTIRSVYDSLPSLPNRVWPCRPIQSNRLGIPSSCPSS